MTANTSVIMLSPLSGTSVIRSTAKRPSPITAVIQDSRAASTERAAMMDGASDKAGSRIG